jgi:hypothetical protein
MNCYYCQQLCYEDIMPSRKINYYCIKCAQKNNLKRWIGFEFEKDKLTDSFIYCTIKGIEFMVVSYFLINCTKIHSYDSEDPITPIMILPGLPITPDNVNEKLKLYLLFS